MKKLTLLVGALLIVALLYPVTRASASTDRLYAGCTVTALAMTSTQVAYACADRAGVIYFVSH